MLKLLIFLLTFVSIGLVSSQLAPLFLQKFQRPLDKKISETEEQLDTMFMRVEKKKLLLLYAAPPFVLGAMGFLLFNSLVFALVAAALGLSLPAIIIKQLQVRRKSRFEAQLLDGILILSSSLKGGLSFLQAIEVLVEELPAPISQEFGLVIREHRMGVALEESLRHLNDRMKLESLGLLINSILVARETGGDLTKILSRLATTIRDNHKLKENIKTLTLQGRMQGIIMSILPFLFVGFVLSANREHFAIMLESDTGRMLLLLAAALQIVGMFLIRKFSTINM